VTRTQRCVTHAIYTETYILTWMQIHIRTVTFRSCAGLLSLNYLLDISEKCRACEVYTTRAPTRIACNQHLIANSTFLLRLPSRLHAPHTAHPASDPKRPQTHPTSSPGRTRSALSSHAACLPRGEMPRCNRTTQSTLALAYYYYY
jgi:hypothetical protein